MQHIKYCIAVFILILLTLSYGARPAKAIWFDNSVTEFLNAINVGDKGGLNSEVGGLGFHRNEILNWVADIGGMCDIEKDATCQYSVSMQHGAIAGLGNATIAIMTNPPASTYAALQDMSTSLGFTKKVNAQGIGFSGLSPMLGLWKAFRNVSYLLLSVILIVIGFMVMFRKKIDPKTVVTVQNSIPRIVVALILITFSYAIVGFMIDLMYFSIVLSSSLLASAAPSGSPIVATDYTGQVFGGGFIGFGAGFFSKFGSIFNDVYNLFTGNNPTTKIVTSAVTGLIGLIVGGLKGAAIGAAAPPGILMLIIAVAMLFGFVRLVFLLIDAYINIILSLITAPLQLMMEAIPGSNSFSSWFKNLISKLSVFPITSALILISGILTSYDSQTTPLWAPPFLSKGGGTFGIGGIIGLGMLLIVPNIAGAIQKALKAEPAIPGGIGPILGPVGQGIGSLTNLIYQGSFISSAIRHKPETRTPVQVVREGAEKGIGGITGGGGSGH
jgi:hypothetical protein